MRYRRVAELSSEGNPAPKRDERSPTGYVRHQRYFLGAQLRGETFRWIMAAEGGSQSRAAAETSTEEGVVHSAPPRMIPAVYGAGLKAVAKCGNLFWNEPNGIAVERAALIMPLVLQGLLFAATIVGTGACFGLNAACILGGLLLLVPFVSDQLLPGVLEPRGVAMFLGGGALLFACALFNGDETARRRKVLLTAISAASAFGALWLDPAVGVPATLVITLARLLAILLRADQRTLPWLWWGTFGAALTFLGALLARVPLSLNSTELRVIHPAYAVAWFGAGYLLHTCERIRNHQWRRRVVLLNLLGSVGILALPFCIQSVLGFPGWLLPSNAMERLTVLENTPAADGVFAWYRAAPGMAVFTVLTPIAFALGGAIWIWIDAAAGERDEADIFAFASLLLLACVGYGAIRIRWLVIAVWVACFVLALAAVRAKDTRGVRVRYSIYLACGLSFVIACLGRLSSIKSAREQPAAWADLEALVYRDLAQWLVKHAPPGTVGVLAPPELTDSVVYHGDFRGLITTAWESGDNALVASRIVSSVLQEEAEALMKKRRISYLVLPSWDKVLGRLVRTPEERRKYALLPRLERWAPPGVLRPIPYHMPPIEGMENQLIAVYQLVEAPDEALALSRLAEYFAEMDKDYLAAAAARILGTSFPGDPNAAIARALVFSKVGDRAAFDGEVSKVEAAKTNGEGALDWDRQVARAIVLALAGRHDVAATATAKCLETASESRLYSLTPLEIYRLNVLAKSYGLAYPTPATSALARELSDQLVSVSGGAVDVRKSGLGD